MFEYLKKKLVNDLTWRQEHGITEMVSSPLGGKWENKYAHEFMNVESLFWHGAIL